MFGPLIGLNSNCDSHLINSCSLDVPILRCVLVRVLCVSFLCVVLSSIQNSFQTLLPDPVPSRFLSFLSFTGSTGIFQRFRFKVAAAAVTFFLTGERDDGNFSGDGKYRRADTTGETNNTSFLVKLPITFVPLGLFIWLSPKYKQSFSKRNATVTDRDDDLFRLI